MRPTLGLVTIRKRNDTRGTLSVGGTSSRLCGRGSRQLHAEGVRCLLRARGAPQFHQLRGRGRDDHRWAGGVRHHLWRFW